MKNSTFAQINITSAMTKNYLFLLLGLLLAACSSDDKDEQPILVTNVVMPASGTVFKAR